MSILVKGMEMPKSCFECVLSHSFFRDLNCANLEGMRGFVGALPHTDDRHPNCPLVLVPPHGRVIDADKLKKHKYYDNHRHEYAVAVAQIDWADTIIEADKGAEK